MHCYQQFMGSVVRASLERSVRRGSTWGIQHGGHSAWTDAQSLISRHREHKGRKEHRQCWKRLEANLSGSQPSVPTACPHLPVVVTSVASGSLSGLLGVFAP